MSAITERRDMGLYEVPLCMSLLGLGIGIMLANFYMCCIMLVLRVYNLIMCQYQGRISLILDVQWTPSLRAVHEVVLLTH